MHLMRYSTGRAVRVAPVALSIVCLLACAVVGCGKPGPQGPTGTVRGRITHQGAPLDAGSRVFFTSESFNASGLVGEDGKFSVESLDGPRIPAGKYQISVAPPSGPELTPEQQMERYDRGEVAGDDPKIPQKYRNSATSELSFEVRADAENECNLDLAG